MKNEITIFNNSLFGEVRVAKTESKPLFHANDIAKALGYENPQKAILDHCKSGNVTKCYVPHDNGIGGVNMQFIPESEVYRLVMRSKLPQAEQFQDWVVEEVLPSLRKTGAYMITKEDDTPEMIMARAVLYANGKIQEMQKNIEQKTKLIELQAPKVEYYDEVLRSNSLHTITTIAATYNMSGATLNKILLLAKVIRKTGDEYSVTAPYQAEDIAKPEKFKYVNSKGETGVKNDLRWTEKGQAVIHDFVKRAINAGVVKLQKGRYIINQEWIDRYEAQNKARREEKKSKSSKN